VVALPRKGAEAIADCESRNAEWEDRWTNKEVEDKVTLLLKQRHLTTKKQRHLTAEGAEKGIICSIED